jgi:GTPase SAR1 family protein
MAENETSFCSNPACRVNETGKCVEGFQLSECPNYRKKVDSSGADEVEENEVEQVEETGHVKNVELPKGERLGVNSLDKIIRSEECRFIALVGPNGAGKTTLIATIFELFGRKPFAGFLFSGSQTLTAFEKACHLSRAASRKKMPKTERTRLGAGLGFFHLGLFDEIRNDTLELLLGDRSGEFYRDIADNPLVVSDYKEIIHANQINILVDGKRLCDYRERHYLQIETQQIIQGLIDSDLINTHQKLVIVLTKYDLIEASNQNGDVKDTFNKYVDKINDLFKTYFKAVDYVETAAMPESDVLPRGWGLEKLLKIWVQKPEPLELTYKITNIEDERAFMRLRT